MRHRLSETQMLAIIEADIASGHVMPASIKLVSDIQDWVKDAQIDLDAPLSAEDEG
jgi:hypothetical protein